jgi:diguanylate cyclase (GGDEF)-like protein
MKAPQPKSKRVAFLAVAPFEAATLLAWVAVLVGTTVDPLTYVLSAVLVVSVGLLPLTDWRPVRFGSVPSAFLYLAAVALLRSSAGGFSSGVGVLAVVPVFYVALYAGRRAIVAVIGGVAVFYLAPIVLVGAPEYPNSQYRVALIAVTVYSIIGLTTQGLVGRVKRGAKEARDRERMLEQVNELGRDLFSSPRARAEICEAARTIGEADVAVLYEPAGPDGAMRSSAIAGIEAEPIEIPAEAGTAVHQAIESRRPVLVTEEPEQMVGSREPWEASGRPGTILYEPLLRGSEAVGVLVVGWRAEVSISDAAVTVVGLLAHEAAAVIERADILSQLTAIAETDALTGLPNRRAWEARLRQARRAGESFTIAILDLDRFKAYNDSFGHPAGDRLLKETAAVWRDQLRAGDLLARIGGEEFGLLLADSDISRAEEVSDRLRRRVTHGQTCSVGFAGGAVGESAHDVMSRADAALYEAKRQGRNRVFSGTYA